MLYLCEDAIAAPIDSFLAEEFGGRPLATNLRRAAEAQDRAALAAYDPSDETVRRRQAADEYDTKIGRYREALDAGCDPVLTAG
ncbi:hypothetical protein AB0J82_35180 [Asanoa sp. NPDC049518]|uniref:hypothetical protein n=1 Tax=unclassified Asanoa TaxID=2685164 RepID=UPI00343E991E